jgi:Rieske Fe-S protein
LRRFGVACAAGPLAACEVSELRETGAVVDFLTFKTADAQFAALAAVDGMVAADAGLAKLLLIRTGPDEVVALDRVCPHQACEMSPGSVGTWDGGAGRLTCNCHGSQFAKDGVFKDGPAGVANLGAYPVTFDAATGEGVVDLREAP